MVLADLGADVIRVEGPGLTDIVRLIPPFDVNNISAMHALLNRSKRFLGLDLKRPGAIEIIKKLIMSYDIVIEQFRPGVMARLGLSYGALKEINPRLIYCSITGYGQNGPLKDRAGHDNNYLSLAGIMSQSGRKESGPAALGVQIADVGGGSFGAITGILAAVIQRQITGQGQVVDISMFDMSVAWNSVAIGNYLIGGENPGYEETNLNGGGYYDYYRTSDGRYLSVGGLEPKFWQGFCYVVGRPDLVATGADPDIETQRLLKAEISKILAQKTQAEWIAIFSEVDVCVEPVLNIAEVVNHPQTIARNLNIEVPEADGSSQKQVASPFKFSGSEAVYRRIGVEPGKDNAEILIEMGYHETEIARMQEQGLFG
jgi:crotonobetainyl-CoA:carnitine CoA-transferase CaiB-like acyl-CoA transferase